MGGATGCWVAVQGGAGLGFFFGAGMGGWSWAVSMCGCFLAPIGAVIGAIPGLLLGGLVAGAAGLAGGAVGGCITRLTLFKSAGSLLGGGVGTAAGFGGTKLLSRWLDFDSILGNWSPIAFGGLAAIGMTLGGLGGVLGGVLTGNPSFIEPPSDDSPLLPSTQRSD